MKKFIKCNDLINFELCVNQIVHSKRNKIKEFDNHNGKVRFSSNYQRTHLN